MMLFSCVKMTCFKKLINLRLKITNTYLSIGLSCRKTKINGFTSVFDGGSLKYSHKILTHELTALNFHVYSYYGIKKISAVQTKQAS